MNPRYLARPFEMPPNDTAPKTAKLATRPIVIAITGATSFLG